MVCLQPVLGRYSQMSFVLKDLLPEMKEFPGDFFCVTFSMSPSACFTGRAELCGVRLKCYDPGDELSPEKGSFCLLFK